MCQDGCMCQNVFVKIVEMSRIVECVDCRLCVVARVLGNYSNFSWLSHVGGVCVCGGFVVVACGCSWLSHVVVRGLFFCDDLFCSRLR